MPCFISLKYKRLLFRGSRAVVCLHAVKELRSQSSLVGQSAALHAHCSHCRRRRISSSLKTKKGIFKKVNSFGLQMVTCPDGPSSLCQGQALCCSWAAACDAQPACHGAWAMAPSLFEGQGQAAGVCMSFRWGHACFPPASVWLLNSLYNKL